MNVSFLISDPQGNIPLDDDLSARPLLLGPNESHPSLSLGDLFLAMASYLTDDDGAVARQAVQFFSGGALDPAGLARLAINKEKQGRSYFVASVEAHGPRGELFRFALVGALTEPGKRVLERDFSNQKTLQARYRHIFLPRLLRMDPFSHRKDGMDYSFLFVVQEWLEGYWEWHLADDGDSGEIDLWDYENGTRRLDPWERDALFRQAARILSYYFDGATFNQVHPWHHGAGDFILRSGNGAIDVRLTTIRDYAPLTDLDPGADGALFASLLQLLLHLCLRMRLDRVAGVGRPGWLHPTVLSPVIAGFADGIGLQIQEGRMPEEALSLPVIAGSFTEAELLALHGPLLDVYQSGPADDLALIRRHLDSHVHELHNALAACSPKALSG